MRILLAIPATLAAVVLIGASCAMNALFWSGQGGTLIAGYILGAVSVSTDIAKSVLPIYIDRAFAARRIMFGLVCSAAFLVFLVAALISAVGFVSQNRTQVAGGAEAVASELAIAKSELAEIVQKLAVLPSYPPIPQLQASLATMRLNRRWKSSDQCSNATAKKSRELCAQYSATEGQLNGAVAQQRMERRRATLRSEIIRLTRAGGDVDAKPQTTMLSKVALLFTPLGTASNVDFWLVLFMAILIEAGAAFVLYAAVTFPAVARQASDRKSSATQVAQHSKAPTKNDATAVASHQSGGQVIDITPRQITTADVDELLKLPPMAPVAAR